MVKEPGICPECGGVTVQRYRPFCSKRCADLDLSRWLRGAYAIAGGNVDEDEDGDDSEAAELAREVARRMAIGDRDEPSGPH